MLNRLLPPLLGATLLRVRPRVLDVQEAQPVRAHICEGSSSNARAGAGGEVERVKVGVLEVCERESERE